MTPSEVVPLSSLLSHALIDLTRQYEQAGSDDDPAPDLVLWSVMLRLFPPSEIMLSRRDLPGLARISSRAMKSVVDGLERTGWMAMGDDPGGGRAKTVRLTAEGERTRRAWEPLAAIAEQAWGDRLGDRPVAALRSALVQLVSQLDLELPHYPVGYGPADASMTGGAWTFVQPVPGRSGPPLVPAHGKDWSPVVRVDSDAISTLPLSALLGQALVAFAIEYEDTRQGPLVLVANVLAEIGDQGLPLSEAPPAGGLAGSGKSVMERHGMVVVEPRGPEPRVVHLTPHGKALRDAYQPLVERIEARWRERHGPEVVVGLRSALEAVDPLLEPGLAAFPVVRFVSGGRFEVS